MHHTEWGPSGLIVEQIVRRAATLTDDERARLREAWDEKDEVALDAYNEAWGKVYYAASKDGRDLTRADADARAASGYSLAGPVGAAAVAAAISDLVGTLGLTSAHVNGLMGPWLEVVGDPRIDPVCECDGSTEPITVDLGALAPQPGDRYPWLVMDAVSPEPLIVGYAATEAEALRLAEKVDGPVLMWRAGKETT